MLAHTLNTIHSVLQHRVFERLIDYSLVLYAILLPLEIISDKHAGVMAATYLIQKILVAEMAVRVVLVLTKTSKEHKSGWFWFDLFTTCASFVPGYEALRALRVLRLVGRWQYFRVHVEEMLTKSAKAVPLLLLAALITYVHGVILFKEYHPVINQMDSFGGAILTASFLILFDGPRETYGAMMSHNWIIGCISMGLTLMVSLIVISQILKVVIEPDEDLETLQAENLMLKQKINKLEQGEQNPNN